MASSYNLVNSGAARATGLDDEIWRDKYKQQSYAALEMGKNK